MCNMIRTTYKTSKISIRYIYASYIIRYIYLIENVIFSQELYNNQPYLLN